MTTRGMINMTALATVGAQVHEEEMEDDNTHHIASHL